VTYLGELKVCGTRVVDADGFVESEAGSCVVGSVAWLVRQEQLKAAEECLRGKKEEL
jgi:hypothetical protein